MITIERVRLDDVDQVTDLFLGYLDFYRRPATREEAEGYLRARLSGAESLILVARQDGRSLGFTQVYPTFSSVSMAPVWTLNDLYVAPEARKSGIGRALIRAVVTEAAAAGAVRVTLSTAEDNTTAQALYESEGFETGHPFKHYVKRTS